MATTDRKTVDVFGDKLEVVWDGNVWVSPHNGQQHSRAKEAMRSELEAYFLASGEDIEDEATAEEIDGYLTQMDSPEGNEAIDVMDYATGDRIGSTSISRAEWARYEAGEHPDYQWPEGVAEAGEVLDDDQLESLGIEPGRVIWLDR